MINTTEIQYVMCPFDDNHKLRQSRYLIHLNKCKSENRIKFEQCNYNIGHWVRIGTMNAHLEVCEDYHNSAVYVRGIIRQQMVNKLAENSVAKAEPTGAAAAKIPMSIGNSQTVSEQLKVVSDDSQRFKLLKEIDWDLMDNPETFVKLTPFQYQTLSRADRKRYIKIKQQQIQGHIFQQGECENPISKHKRTSL